MEEIYNIIELEKKDFFSTISSRITPDDMLRIEKAYEFAFEAHSAQKRQSGEPYITHPLAVAKIVGEELMLDANTIIAAFLHDVVEDTPHTNEEINEMFGDDVAFIVRVVTKQKKEHYEMSKQLDNFKQMLYSVNYDIRALLIKLSDRLHNMRTLDSMRPDKQMKIAGETDYFYAPLANRLGLYDVKTELENLSMRYRCPQEYALLEDALKVDEIENREWLTDFTGKINKLLKDNGIEARLEVQYRMPYSIWRKMQKTDQDFQHLDHRHIISIIFPNNSEVSEKHMCLRIYSLLTDVFKEKPGSLTNYIDSPKESGYQSFHVKLLCEHVIWEEIHILSERMILNSRLGCVADRGDNNIDKWIDKLKEVLKDIASVSNEGGFMENIVTSFYNDDILVFTPQGHGIILPKGATALDFAFEIHSEIGVHAQYARINGKLSSIKKVLRRGDCVEIGKDKDVTPRLDWLEHAHTYKARRFLESHLRKVKKLPYDRCNVCHPLPGDEVIGFGAENEPTMIHKRDCLLAIRLASQDGDSIVSIDLEEDEDIHYPVMISIKAVDRYHLLSDLINCITDKLHLSIDSLKTTTTDEIVNCSICFAVHSVNELQQVLANIRMIKGVDEVRRRDISTKSEIITHA